LDDNFGIDSGAITTIHSAMNDQPVIDSYHDSDLRKTRSAMQSIIPVETALAKGIERILPHLAGKLEAQAVRVPTVNVSAMDLSINVSRDTSIDEVIRAIKNASKALPINILGVTEEPLASCDFNHDPRSAVVDLNQTKVINRRLIKLLVWFDNEWAYANRMLDVAQYMCRLG
jgi:D-erythrose 4-phosphate dehydrogenase